MALVREDFDNMEESLRNALRQNTNLQLAQKTPVFEQGTRNKISKKIVNKPNVTDFQRPVSNVCNSVFVPGSHQQRQSNLDDFRMYCDLTERIRKIEEQNTELLRKVERQKVEYDKVVAQVVESEHNQRALVNQCTSLRQQVQQLTTRNRNLEDHQQTFGYEARPRSSTFLESNNSSGICGLAGSPNTQYNLNHSSNNLVEALNAIRRSSSGALGNINATNLAAAVELFTALQLVSHAPELPNRGNHVVSSENPPLRNASAETCTETSFLNERQGLFQGNQEKTVCDRVQTNVDNKHNSSNVASDKDDAINDYCSASTIANIRLNEAKFTIDNRLPNDDCDKVDTQLKQFDEKDLSVKPILSSNFESTTENKAEYTHNQNDEEITQKMVPERPFNLNDRDNVSLSPSNLKKINDKCFENNLGRKKAFEVSSSRTEVGACSGDDVIEMDLLIDNIFQFDEDMDQSDKSSTSIEGFPMTSSKFVQDSNPKLIMEVNKAEKDNEQLILDSSVSLSYKSHFNDVLMEGNCVDNASDLFCSFGENPKNYEDQSLLNNDKQGLIVSQNLTSDETVNTSKSNFKLQIATFGQDSQSEYPEQVVANSHVEQQSSQNYSPDQIVPSSPSFVYNYEKSEDMFSDPEDCLESGNEDFIFISSSPQTHPDPYEIKVANKLEKLKISPLTKSPLKKRFLSPSKSKKYNVNHSATEISHKPPQRSGKILKKIQSVEVEESSHNFEDIKDRTLSEGASPTKNKVKARSGLVRRELRRQRSVSSNEAVDQKPDLSSPPTSPSYDIHNAALVKSRGIPQRPRFPSTNPHSRLVQSASKDSYFSFQNFNQNLDAKKMKDAPKMSSPSNLQGIGQKVSKPSSDNKSIPVEDMQQQQNKHKLSKKNKNPLLNGDNKRGDSFGGTQSRSLVGLVKAKFSRNSTKYSLSSNNVKKSTFEYTKRSSYDCDDVSNKFVIDGSFSSLETPYLPPGKDGDLIRKLSKQKSDEKHSDMLEVSEISESSFDGETHILRRSSEDILSDEGYAEGSTIERSEIDDSSPSSLPQEHKLPGDIESLRSKMFPNTGLQYLQSASSCYSSVSSDPSEKYKLRQEETHTSFPSSVPISTRVELIPINRNNLHSADQSGLDKSLLDSITRNALDGDAFITGITVVPSSHASRLNRAPLQTGKLQPRKLQKASSGSAFGRFIKSVSGSKDDLSPRNKETSNVHKQELKRSNLGVYRKDMEKAFMSGIVEAELAQNNGRCAVKDYSILDKSKNDANVKSPSTSTNSSKSGSIGSSFSSLPSVGSISSRGGDSSESSGNTRFGKHGKENDVILENEPSNQSSRLFGQKAPFKKTNSIESTSSTTDSESNFQDPENITQKTAKVVNLKKCESSAKKSIISKPALSEIRSGKLLSFNNPSFSTSADLPSNLPNKNSARNSKISAPKKLLQSNSNAGVSLKSTSKVSNHAGKTKLAPLNYGAPTESNRKIPTQGPSAAEKDQPVKLTNKISINSHQAEPRKLKPTTSKHILRNPNSALKAPTTRSSVRCGNNQIQPPKSRIGLISSKIQRPRSLQPGM